MKSKKMRFDSSDDDDDDDSDSEGSEEGGIMDIFGDSESAKIEALEDKPALMEEDEE